MSDFPSDGTDVATTLSHLAVLAVDGPDSGRFLHGQLSNDLLTMTTEHARLAGYHNPQGRVISIMQIVRLAEASYWLILPDELLESVRERMLRFRLRSKFSLQHASDLGLFAWGESRSLGDAEPFALRAVGDTRFIRQAGAGIRWLQIRRRGNETALDGSLAWRGADIAAGQPQVYAATSESFVAQMLNLDLVGAIAFDKGCYTGQEVIARAHYRGRVKRRMQRFAVDTRLALAPGRHCHAPDGRRLDITDALATPTGYEVLAVANLPGSQTREPTQEAVDVVEAVHELPLPYALPAN
ncbi:MAG: hypothetical protein R3E77_07280 [Steroidobacteraceae bacterium]